MPDGVHINSDDHRYTVQKLRRKIVRELASVPLSTWGPTELGALLYVIRCVRQGRLRDDAVGVDVGDVVSIAVYR
ncbi:hypothetical protein FK535_09140 [Mycolicibacterium sp. 018/SC-01/001]|uniref:hypothetical protein n=1 Tax=Mycolicibacterium sp. 018/SC-01/001 TaxID=2592069 RepID=UPI0011802BAE|nr:hypothetical protein [Mycolicibacterium sp. 018/SC-01/001]TRW85550.1 hypothetical protein FK535_09140 [Mycolicibacterium sp. 018/SC-01/001]